MRTRRKMITLLLLLTFMAVSMPAWASLGDAVSMTTSSAVEIVTGLTNFVVGVPKLVAGSIWTVGEVLIFPFRLIGGK